jgi:cell division protein FtsB
MGLRKKLITSTKAQNVLYCYRFERMMKLRLQLRQGWTLYFLASLIFLLLTYTIVGERGLFHLWRLRGEKAKLDEQNFRLQKENETLRQRVARLRHDDSYLEKIAREELNLVRPGEVIYRFSTPETSQARSRALSGAGSESPPSAAQKSRR